MAISFVGSKSFTAAGAASGTHSVSLTNLLDTSGASATLLQGDLVLINYGTGSSADRSFTPPSGYTEDQELYSNASTFDTNQCIWWKVMGATPDTTVDLPASGNASDALAATIFAFRGVDTTTPLDVASATATGTGSTNANGPSITPSTAGAWIVVCGAGSAGTGVDLTNAANLSSTTNHFRSAWSVDDNDVTAATGIKTDWLSGAFDPAAFDSGSTNAARSWTAVTLALRPASSGSITGTASPTLGTFLSSAAAKALIEGQGGGTLNAFTATAVAKVRVKATASLAIGSFVSASAAKALVEGVGSGTLNAFSSTAAAKVRIKAAAQPAPGAFTLSATGVTQQGAIQASASITLGEFLSSSAAKALVEGIGGGILNPFGVSASASLRIKISGAPTLSVFTSNGVIRQRVDSTTPASRTSYSQARRGSASSASRRVSYAAKRAA